MRLIGLVILSASLALAPLTAEAQQAGKVYRIGFLWDTPAVWPHALEAFRQGLRDLGWIAGDTTRELRPHIPPGTITVSESGISSTADRDLMASLQIDALLVGEGLLASPDIARATREISGVQSPVPEGSLR